MTLNNIARRNNSDLVDLISVSRVPLFRTIEAQRNYEHQIFRLDSFLDELKDNLETLSPSKQLFVNDWRSYNLYISELINKINNRANYLQQILTEYDSEKESSYASLEGQITKAKRKVSYLNSLTGAFSWISSEHFLSFQLLNTNVNNFANVNTDAEECTLPISLKEERNIKEIIIDIGSNCIVGAPNGTNNRTANLLSRREETGFSVYSKNQNECKLVLDVELEREQVVNFIVINKNKNAKSFLKKINDIIIFTSSGTSVSIKTICKNPLVFKETKDALEVHFLPVKASSLKVIITQENYYYENQIKINQIDLESIGIYGLKYKALGVLESVDLNFNKFSALITDIDLFPESENNILTAKIKKSDKIIDLNIGEEPTLLEESLTSLKWEVSFERNILENTFPLSKENVYNYDLLTTYFNPLLIEQIETKRDYYKKGIKVAQLIQGSISQSNISVVDLELDELSLKASVETRVHVDVNSQDGLASLSLNSGAAIQNDSQRICNIRYATSKPLIKSEENNYYFDIGEIFELNSIKLIYNNVEYSDLNIWQAENQIKGFVISKDKLSFKKEDYLLSDYRNQDFNGVSYFFRKPIILNTLLFKDNLGEGLEAKTYINGSSEFSNLSSYIEEGLNSQNVTEGTVIAFEPSQTVSSEATVSLYKSGFEFATVLLEENVNISSLQLDVPKLDTTTNVLYIKTSETSFFSEYSLVYKYESLTGNSEISFSVDYENGIIYFSNEVDDSKKISFESPGTNWNAKFTLAKYLNVDINGDYIQIYDQNAYKKLKVNLMHVYLPEVAETINISGLEDYYSPILYSVELKAT